MKQDQIKKLETAVSNFQLTATPSDSSRVTASDLRKIVDKTTELFQVLITELGAD